MVPDPGMDRLSGGAGTPSELSARAEASNLTDVWRWHYPRQRAYTCHSTSHKTFSRIDLFYAGGSVPPRIQDISILPCGTSDHARLKTKCVHRTKGQFVAPIQVLVVQLEGL